MTDEESWELKARTDRYMSRVATAVAVEADRKFFEALNMSQVEITIGESSTGCPVDDGAILNRIATQGSVAEFAANWQRPEAEYCHFTRGEPENQIQFAFRQNWLEFAKIMEPLKPWAGKRSLEVGAGRGTMSMYFADNGFDVTLLDACEKPLEQAHKQFERHGLKCHCHVGDAMKLPFEDESFDVVHSYGLLEHFRAEDEPAAIAEQLRVLKSGGMWIAYVVPCQPNGRFAGVDAANEVIRMYSGCVVQDKPHVYRNLHTARFYMKIIEGFGVNCDSRYVYPFPMIGPSAEFPFSLNPPEIEREIVGHFTREGRWYAYVDEAEGDSDPFQGFIVWGWKR